MKKIGVPKLVPISQAASRSDQSSMMTMQRNATSSFAEGPEAERSQHRLAVEMGKRLFAGRSLTRVRTISAP